ncbi:MAG: transcriptional regulator, AraC family [Phycisphaerales bacterium]|nr:transcriptional regulator, AraC family [Phycisphaerales bacterium]
MTATGRDQWSVRHLLDGLKKAVPFTSGLVLSVVPRGALQIAQPSNVPDALLKSYAKGFQAEDRLSWQVILKRKPMRANDAYNRDAYESTPYFQEFVQPQGLKYAVALPLAAPILDGYPGVVHVFRTPDQGDFSSAEVQTLLAAVHQFDARRQAAREAKPRGGAPAPLRLGLGGDAATASFIIVDGKLKPVFNNQGLASLDNHLREQMLDHAKRRMHQVNGHSQVADRVQFPDSHGDVLVYRLVTYRHFPALGDGPYTFLCRQPGCVDWGAVKPQDFQADPELSRLIPALKFMQQEFSRGPTLVEIAKQVHLSPFHFHRRFTELLGLTPKQFLLECQIHEAKSELVARQKELALIAKDCGFAHQSHFTSRFKQATGLTPTRWRRMVSDRRKAVRS